MVFLNPKFISFTLLLFAAVGISYFWILPAWDEIKVAQNEIGVSESLLVRKQKEKSLLVDLEKHYKEYYQELYSNKLAVPYKADGKSQEDVPDLYILPRKENLSELLVQLEALATESGIIMKSVNFQTTGASSQPKEGDRAPSYQTKTINIGLSLEGTYKNFKDYLNKIEKNNRLIDVVSVSFGSGPEGSTSFSVSARAYFQ